MNLFSVSILLSPDSLSAIDFRMTFPFTYRRNASFCQAKKGFLVISQSSMATYWNQGGRSEEIH